MVRFQGEDFIVINIDEVENKGEVRIQNARINHFRDNLRENGVIYDLGIREFETLRFRYPGNICIETQSIKITRTESFVQVFERRKIERGPQLSSITALWKTTK